MSFDNTSTTSQSNMGSSAQGTGIPSAANNPYTTNFSPNMNMNSVAGGQGSQGSADASQISTPRFPISKKSKLPWKIIFGVLLLVMLIGGGGAGYYLTQMNQDVRQQASQQQGFSYETQLTSSDTWRTLQVGQSCEESIQCLTENCVKGTCGSIQCFEKKESGSCNQILGNFSSPSDCTSAPNRYSSKARCDMSTYIAANQTYSCWQINSRRTCMAVPLSNEPCNRVENNKYPTEESCKVAIDQGRCTTNSQCINGTVCVDNECVAGTGTGGTTQSEICTNSTQCSDGKYCSGLTCIPKIALNQSCTQNGPADQCVSGTSCAGARQADGSTSYRCVASSTNTGSTSVTQTTPCWIFSGNSCSQLPTTTSSTYTCNSGNGFYPSKSICENSNSTSTTGTGGTTPTILPSGSACNPSVTTSQCIAGTTCSATGQFVGNQVQYRCLAPQTSTGGNQDPNVCCEANGVKKWQSQSSCLASDSTFRITTQAACTSTSTGGTGLLADWSVCNSNSQCLSKNCRTQGSSQVCYPASSTETGTNNQVTTTTTATCTSIGAGVGACLNGKSCTIQDITLNRSATGAPCGSNGQIYACWNRSGTSCVSISSSNQSCNPSLGSYPSESTCKSTINCRTVGEGTCLNGKTCTGDDFDKSRTVASGLSCGAGAGGNSPKLCYEIKNNTCVSTASNFLGLCNTFTQYNSYNICKSALDQKNNGGNTNTGGTGTGGTPTQCILDNEACGSERGLSDTCCGTAICQGYSGNRRCENPGVTGDQICGAGSTCTGWAGFKCDALHTSISAPGGQLVCEQNGQSFTDRTDAANYAGQCGQIDRVCVGGSNAGKLCGEFNIINNNCGVPPVPPVTPEPTPPVVLSCDSTCTTNEQCQSVDSRFTCHATGDGTSRCRLATNTASNICQPAVGPMCLSLTKTNVTDATRTTPKLGDAISLTCGEVPLATRYIFRVVQPDGTILDLNGTGRTSEPFVISKSGHYTAQCQICTGAEASTCLPYEPVK